LHNILYVYYRLGIFIFAKVVCQCLNNIRCSGKLGRLECACLCQNRKQWEYSLYNLH